MYKCIFGNKDKTHYFTKKISVFS